MVRPKTNYVIDLLMAIAFLGVAVTGVMKWPGLLKWVGINTANLPWYFLSKIHDWSGIVMTALVFLHLVLHWKWIVVTTKSFFKKKVVE